MGYALIRAALCALALALLCMPADAQEKPRASDSKRIQDCIKSKTGRGWKWESCIGIVSESCSKDEASMPSSAVVACYDRERAVWDDILNETYRRLREALDDEQKDKLREMQRAWIASRDKSCGFFYDIFQGSMANPMIAACITRETGRRALFLRPFLDDVPAKQ
jgi:uncharacterized protein YecT (DUF1311 family)